jgi:hypothetical protein
LQKKRSAEALFLVYKDLFGMPFTIIEGFDEIDAGG